MTQWYDDDSFWADTEAVVFTPERLTGAADEVDQVVKLVELAPGSAVLDLGCGPGRHSLAFAERGYRVTGVDRTARYLDRARNSAAEQNLEIEWVHADMREFCREESFDLTVSLLTSFGYFEDAADDRRVMQHAVASLRPGGRMVIEMMGKEILARIFRQRDWQELRDGTLLLEHREVSDDWSWLNARWIIVRAGERIERCFRLRVYSAVELKNLLTDVGFASVHAYGSLAGTPYDHNAQRTVIVAEKG